MPIQIRTEEVMVCTCSRCNNEWKPKDQNKTPLTCPKCHSPYWNRARKYNLTANKQ